MAWEIFQSKDETNFKGIIDSIRKRGIFFRYNHDFTIIYHSQRDRDDKWTQNISDIIEIKPGVLPEEEATKLCKNYID